MRSRILVSVVGGSKLTTMEIYGILGHRRQEYTCCRYTLYFIPSAIFSQGRYLRTEALWYCLRFLVIARTKAFWIARRRLIWTVFNWKMFIWMVFVFRKSSLIYQEQRSWACGDSICCFEVMHNRLEQVKFETYRQPVYCTNTKEADQHAKTSIKVTNQALNNENIVTRNQPNPVTIWWATPPTHPLNPPILSLPTNRRLLILCKMVRQNVDGINE